MDTNWLSTVPHLSNEALLSKVKILAAREREATVALIAHLAELDDRRLYLAEGYSSLFVYCTQVLHLSEHAAYGRIEAARAVRRFPVLLERLAEGTVTLTTVGLLAPHLTVENHRELLDAACHKTKRQVEELVARLRPQPPVPASVRRLPMPRPSAASPSPGSPCASGTSPVSADVPATSPEPSADASIPSLLLSSATAAPTAAPTPTRPATIEPLAPQRYRVQFTASAETYEKFQAAQALLRHQIPDGDPAAIFDRALTALLDVLARQKFAATDRPRGSKSTAPHSRHIPAEVKRTVWQRDGGQCAFVSPTGRRCTEQGFLEFHHVVPYSVGGRASVDNIQLRCRAHNSYEIERVFGRGRPLEVREVSAVYMNSTEPLSAPHCRQHFTATGAGPSNRWAAPNGHSVRTPDT